MPVESRSSGKPTGSQPKSEHLIGLARFLQAEYLPSASMELYRARIVTNGPVRGVAFEPIDL